jgi:DNA replication protein DnaC
MLEKNGIIEQLMKNTVENNTFEIQKEKQETESLEIRQAREIGLKFGPRFADCSFENYNVTNPKQTEAVRSIKNYLAMDKGRGESLLLFGESGTGKTHLMVAMAKSMVNIDFKVTSFEKLFEKKRVAQAGHHNWFEVVTPWVFADVLFIPDLIVRKSGFTDSQKELLLYLFDERYKNFLPMILSTNVPVPDLKTALDFEGTQRIVDRLKELIGNRVVCFDWESHRKLN